MHDLLLVFSSLSFLHYYVGIFYNSYRYLSCNYGFATVENKLYRVNIFS